MLPDGTVVMASADATELLLIHRRIGLIGVVPFDGAEAHCLAVLRDGGRDLLWVADPGFKHAVSGGRVRERLQDGRLVLLDFEGRVVRRIANPYRDVTQPFRPTAIAVEDPSLGARSPVWVADGYGSNSVLRLSAEGDVLFRLDGAAGKPFDCPHGIAVSIGAHGGEVVIADRANFRLVVLDGTGAVTRVLIHPLFTAPSSLAYWRSGLLVTDLDEGLYYVEGGAVVPLVAGDGEQGPGWPNRVTDAGVEPPLLLGSAPRAAHGLGVDAADGIAYLSEWCLDGRLLEVRLETMHP
ncbi:hypothetical protein ACFUTX_08860 [Microbacterium sp. NPDC057407]|uniref:hypothetical protein n=1 Tax=Microbacterium sp. NPDC057407 TaxID=3346120 RepID=UPI00366BC6C1